MANINQTHELRKTLIDIMTARIEQTRAICAIARQLNNEAPDVTSLEASAAQLASEARNTALLAQEVYSAVIDMRRAA